MNKTVWILAIATILVCASVTPAFAKSSSRTVVANGVGAMVCPDGTIINGMEFEFTAHQENRKGPISTDFVMRLPGVITLAMSDPSAGGDIKMKKFIVDTSGAGSIICDVEFPPSSFTITIGRCGPNSQVTFTNSFGITGSYNSNVLCF